MCGWTATLGQLLHEVSRRRTSAIPPSLLETRHSATGPSRCMSNFVCRWRTSPTWTNFIPVVKTHQTQADARSEEHTSELQSLMSKSYAVFCLKKTNQTLTIS